MASLLENGDEIKAIIIKNGLSMELVAHLEKAAAAGATGINSHKVTDGQDFCTRFTAQFYLNGARAFYMGMEVVMCLGWTRLQRAAQLVHAIVTSDITAAGSTGARLRQQAPHLVRELEAMAQISPAIYTKVCLMAGLPPSLADAREVRQVRGQMRVMWLDGHHGIPPAAAFTLLMPVQPPRAVLVKDHPDTGGDAWIIAAPDKDGLLQGQACGQSFDLAGAFNALAIRENQNADTTERMLRLLSCGLDVHVTPVHKTTLATVTLRADPLESRIVLLDRYGTRLDPDILSPAVKPPLTQQTSKANATGFRPRLRPIRRNNLYSIPAKLLPGKSGPKL